ncbi:MAG TPA: bifunctional diaminohydroxyphosphoribosylaminopyrimidine deaminase/5-amino-6-(5-phosphoribosylamino)uracil reductase RibD [Acidobacteriota bacterium]|nr:bifunctional diaminohydroxyphosphoribosylaminopyrimidine deaminase/5-amino-6-(5-phosphoribosylamino)uracil reductase RibD [Acidobacteriota bacterium]
MTGPSDRAWMEMAYGLAEKARGRTSPNPLVGAVVVRGGAVAGFGFHEEPGKPHAEIIALGRAGRKARGATLYVTLEPCVHWGRTPPCVDAVLAAGLGRVVVSAVDPNPLVDGRGLRRLQEAGLEVSAGLLAGRNTELNETYIKYITRKIPFVTLKAALTVDGKIACRTGDSKWISSAATRDYVHLLRGEQDALMIGAGTLLADDPRLTVRHALWAGKKVRRIVLDRRLRFPLDGRMLAARGGGPILVFAGREAPADKVGELERRGAEVVRPPAGAGDWPLDLVLAELGRREIAALLVEGGSRLFTSFIEARLADKAILTLAPRLAGGAASPGLFGGEGRATVAAALPLRRTRTFAVGDDIILEGYF